MSRPDITAIRLLSAPEYDAASVLLCSINELESARVSLRDDGSHRLVLTAPAEADWLEFVRARRVVWLASEGRDVSEWLISRDSITLGEAGGSVQVHCDPLYTVLADVGMIEHPITGGIVWTNLGGRNLSVRNYINTFIVSTLTRHGIDWIAAGDIDPTEGLTLSFEGLTPLSLLVRCAQRTDTVWRLRRDEPNSRYLIDVLDSFAGDEVVRLTEGRNVLGLLRRRSREQLFTVIRPVGVLPDGSEQRADIGQALWKVKAVSGDDVTLEAPDNGPGPVLEDSQHVGLYLMEDDGTCHEIEGTNATTQVLSLETGSGAAWTVGDNATIVADDDGTHLTELQSPSAIALYGRIQGRADFNLRGERNHITNPFFGHWDADPVAVSGRADGGGISATQDLKDLPATMTIPEGTAFVRADAGVVYRVQSGTATDGDGKATVTLSATVTLPDETAVILVLQGVSTRCPVPWIPLPAGTNVLPLVRTPRGAADPVAGKIDGAQTLGDTTVRRLVLKDLPAGAEVASGSWMTPGPTWIIEGGTADGAGALTVEVWTPGAFSDDADVEIHDPGIAGEGDVCSSPFKRGGAGLLAQTFSVRYVEGLGQLRVQAAARSVAIQTGTQWEAGTAALPPRLSLEVGGSEVTATTAEDWSADAVGEARSYTLRLAHEIAADSTLTVKFAYPYDTTSTNLRGPWTYLLATQLHLGTDGGAPFVDGSHATQLFQEGNLALLAHRQWPATYVATVAELADEWGIDPSSPALELGGIIRVTIGSLDLDLLLKVVGLEIDPFDPGATRVMLDTSPSLLTKETVRARPRPLYVNVDVEVVDDKARKTVLTTEDPPDVEGAPRSTVPDGSTPPAGDDIIDIGFA